MSDPEMVKVELEAVCDCLNAAEPAWEHTDPSYAELCPDEEQ